VVHLGEAESPRKVVGLDGVAKVGQQVSHDLNQWRTVACLDAGQTLIGSNHVKPVLPSIFIAHLSPLIAQAKRDHPSAVAPDQDVSDRYLLDEQWRCVSPGLAIAVDLQ
jgi:hypothetical protein